MDEVEKEGVWVKGQFKKRNVSSPRCAFLWSTSQAEFWFMQDTNCIAICKMSCLQTRSIEDGSYETSTLDYCKYPNSILSECSIIPDPIEKEDQRPDLTETNQEPDACHYLYVNEDYLKNYTFFDEEVVWIRVQKPFPLERVVLRPSDNCSPELTTDHQLHTILSQLSEQCLHHVILVQRDFEFLHQVSSSAAETVATPSLSEEALFYNDVSGEWCLSGDDLPPPASFDVLDTTPLLQGRITSRTNIIIIPPIRTSAATEDGSTPTLTRREEERQHPCPSPDSSSSSEDNNTFEKDGMLIRSGGFRLESLSSASDIRIVDDEEDDSVVQEKPLLPLEVTSESHTTPYVFPSRPPYSPSASAEFAASYGSNSYGTPPSLSTSDPPQFIIEVRSAPGYRLHYHFVLLPRQLAMRYDIYGLQNVLITTISAGPAHRGDHTQTADMVIPLNNDLGRGRESLKERRKTRQHLAIVNVYDTPEDLESYVPQIMLGRRYQSEDLLVAYLHPEMLFGLFPETLSTSPRRYVVKIEVRNKNKINMDVLSSGSAVTG